MTPGPIVIVPVVHAPPAAVLTAPTPPVVDLDSLKSIVAPAPAPVPMIRPAELPPISDVKASPAGATDPD